MFPLSGLSLDFMFDILDNMDSVESIMSINYTTKKVGLIANLPRFLFGDLNYATTEDGCDSGWFATRTDRSTHPLKMGGLSRHIIVN